MHRGISFNPGNFHYKQPTQEARDRPESSAAGSSLVTPGGIAADAAAIREQMEQCNKTVLDNFIQKAERHSHNTKLTIHYYRDALEEVADFLAEQPQPQIHSLQDLQRLNSSNLDDRMRVDALIKEFYTRGKAKITLGHEFRTSMFFRIFDALSQSVSLETSIKLWPSEISRQAERLTHEYANTPLDRAKISKDKLRQYSGDLKFFSKWLDAKMEKGYPISDEENSLEKLGSLEKLLTYPNDESVKRVIERFLQESQNDSKVPKKTKNGIGKAVESFRKLMRSQESGTSGLPVPVTAPAAAAAATPVFMSGIQFQLLREFNTEAEPFSLAGFMPGNQFQLLREFNAEAAPSAPSRQENLQTKIAGGATATNKPVTQTTRPMLPPISPQAANLIRRYRNEAPKNARLQQVTVDVYARILKYLARWIEKPRMPGQGIPHGLDSLEKLGSHHDNGQVEEVLKNFKEDHRKHPSIVAGVFRAVASLQQVLWPEIHAPKIRISPRAEQIIATYKLIVQEEGSHKERPQGTIEKDAWSLKYLATWVESAQEIPHGLDSLEKLGGHRDDDEVKAALASFKQNSAALPSAKNQIQGTVNVFRWIWHRIEAKLKEEQAIDDFAAELEADLSSSLSPYSPQNAAMTDATLSENPLTQPHRSVPEASDLQTDTALDHMPQTGEIGAAVIEDQEATFESEWDNFAAELEAELSSSLSPYSPQNATVTDATLSEDPLVQPHRTVSEASDLQTDTASDHMPQTGEIGAAAIEDQELPFESEWDNMPFDPVGLDAMLYGFESMPLGDAFFATIDEDLETLQAASPTQERQYQPGSTVTSQAGVASSSQAEFGTARSHTDVNPSSSSTVPAPLAPHSSGQAEFRQQLLGKVGETARLKRPAPEPQTESRSVRSRTAPPLAPPRPQQTALQQRLLDHASSLTMPSFPSRPRSRRSTADKDKN